MLGLVLAFVHWGYVCVFFIASSLSISQSVLFGDILCLMLVTILHWGIPLSLSSSDLLRTFSLFDLFIDLCGSSHWGIPPSLGLSGLLRTFSLLDLFFDLCESSHWGIPSLVLFYWVIHPSLWVCHVSCWFHDWQTHLLIFASYHLGHPPTVSLFRASPYCHLV